MSESSLTEINVTHIVPSPFQHRCQFDEASLRELANSIQQDGLIQPITVRPVNAHYELIAGERRWRAFKIADIQTIPARVLHVDDLQARRLCATENLQRSDLTPLEEVMALADLVDASLLEFSDEYAPLSTIQHPKWRVRTLLMKLESDRKNGTDYFSHKFMAKVETIFSGLPKPKDVRSFEGNDLPLLFTSDEVQQFALEHKLNKSQTKAVAKLNEIAPDVFKEISKSTPQQAVEQVKRLADPLSFYTDQQVEHEEVELFSDLSAETIRKAAKNTSIQPEHIHNHRALGTGENEWYTPAEHIELARSVLGIINLDPATSEIANRVVKAEHIFTYQDNGLTQQWFGNVWMNPPYSQPHIQEFIEKLVFEYQSKRTDQAIALTHNYTDTAWFHHAAEHCQAICFTRGRISFIDPYGVKHATPTQGQAFFYFGNNVDNFIKTFSSIGCVMVRP